MDIMRMGTAAICAGAMALIGISHYSGEDAKPAPVFITMPASSPSASICEVKCPGYEEPDTSYHAAPAFLYGKPTVPTTGVVTVYVAAPVSAAQAAQSAPKATGQGKASAPKASKASSSKSSGTSKAPKATAAPKQTVPSTTVTTKTSVSTHSTAKGSTTTQSSSTTTTHKG